MSQGANMRWIALCAALLFVATECQAQSLDGTYTSNRGNKIIIKGNSYTYIGVTGGPERSRGSLRSGADGIRFTSGYLSYPCTLSGSTLICAGGRRVWTKN